MDEQIKNERTLLQKKANLASETFIAGFKEKLEQMPTVLSSMPFEHAVGTMVKWLSQLIPRQAVQESFSSIEGCSSRLIELTSKSNDSTNRNSATLSPFIRKLRVYMRAYILSKGLILADLPGLRDLNSARKAITEHYIRQCHQIFVVAEINRAITDESIKEVFGLASDADLAKIDVICTKSDLVNTEEATGDWPAQRTVIERMQNEIVHDTQIINSINQEIAHLVGADENPNNLDQEEERLLMKLFRDLRKVKKSAKNHDCALFRYIVELRNDNVSNGLKKEYQNQPIASTMRIFCVSSKMYENNRENPATEALPYLKMSGILELRRYCIGIVAQSRLRATKEFTQGDIPAFLGSVELWVKAGSGNTSAQKKQQILNAVTAIQRELDEVRSY